MIYSAILPEIKWVSNMNNNNIIEYIDMVNQSYLEKFLVIIDIPEIIQGFYRQNASDFNFKEIVEIFEFNGVFIEDYENSSEDINFQIAHNIMRIMDKINTDGENLNVKCAYKIILFNLLDTSIYNPYVFFNTSLKRIIDSKISEILSNNHNGHNALFMYLKNNLIVNRRYIMKKNFHIYIWNRLFVHMQVSGRFLKIFREVVNKRYTPGGVGYLEAKKDFESIASV